MFFGGTQDFAIGWGDGIYHAIGADDTVKAHIGGNLRTVDVAGDGVGVSGVGDFSCRHSTDLRR